MKKVSTFCISFVAFMMIVGCSKEYRTYKKILGDYTLTTYTVNGVDSLSSYKDSLGTSFKFYLRDKDKNYIWEISGQRNDGKEKYLGWYWELNSGSILHVFEAYGNGVIGIGPLGNYAPLDWEILNLTKKELKMKTTWNGKEYVVNLEK